jgi:hypothetical protein
VVFLCHGVILSCDSQTNAIKYWITERAGEKKYVIPKYLYLYLHIVSNLDLLREIPSQTPTAN